MDDVIRLIYSPTVYRHTGESFEEVPCESYLDAVANKKVGDVITIHAGAPGCGYVKYRITSIDDEGVCGIVIEDTVRELEAWEVI